MSKSIAILYKAQDFLCQKSLSTLYYYYTMIYVKDCLKCKLIEWPTEIDVECIGLNITISPEMSFTVICLYRPPSSKNRFYDQLKTILKCNDFRKEIIPFLILF